jgi:hypothetical protein
MVALTLGNAPRTDLLVSTPNGNVHFEVDVKNQPTRNFWLVQKRASVESLYYVLVYLPREADERPRFFVLSGAAMMEKRAEYQRQIESQSGKYRDDVGGIHWSTAFCFEDEWDVLPGYKSLGHAPPNRQAMRSIL